MNEGTMKAAAEELPSMVILRPWALCVTSTLIVPNMLSVSFYQCVILSMLFTVGRQDAHTGTRVVNLLWSG